MAAFDPITAIGNLIDKILPDRAQADAAKAALMANRENNDVKLILAQLAINQADAQSKNMFQAGWRPALAWSCVLSFIYHFLFFPMLGQFMLKLHDIAPGDFSIMMGVLTVLIGARTYDKAKGTDTP